MDINSVIEIFGAMIAALGGYETVKWAINAFVHRKQEAKLKKVEVEQKETEADVDEFHLYKERLEELREANTEINKQNLELIKTGARKDEIIEAKTKEIREIQDLRAKEAKRQLEATKRIGELEKEVMYFKSWKCFREYGKSGERCARRKPVQNPPLKYEPIENMQ